MNLIDFYTNTLTSLGFEIKENKIYVDDGRAMLNDNNIPYALPSKENLKDILNPDGTPKMVIYNPLIEDSFTKKTEFDSLSISLKMAKLKLGHSMIYLGKLLMLSIENASGEFKLNDYYSSLSSITKNRAIKKIVDDTTLAAWENICVKALIDPETSDELKLLEIKQSKSSKVGKDKFNTVTSVYSPILDYILEQEKEDNKITEILDQKLRPKDVSVIKYTLLFLLNGIEDTEHNTISLGSNSDFSRFDSLMTIYITLAEYFNELSTLLKDFSSVDYDFSYINLTVSLDDMTNLEVLRRDALIIPSEKSLIGNVTNPSVMEKLKINAMKINDRPGVVHEMGNATQFTPQTQQSNGYPLQQQTTTGYPGQTPNIGYPAHDPRYAQQNIAYQQPVQQPVQAQQPVQETSMFDKVMNKITNRPDAAHHNVPNINNYNGNRPDLHVSHIYNEAQPGYNMYNPNNQHSRIQQSQQEYIPASARVVQHSGYSRGQGYGQPIYDQPSYTRESYSRPEPSYGHQAGRSQPARYTSIVDNVPTRQNGPARYTSIL